MTITDGSYPLGSLAKTTAAAAAAATLSTLLLYRSYTKSLPTDDPKRPQLILDAIANDSPIYYFGVGSNLSRKKLENRSICGKKIHIVSMEPCVIPGFRLAFNMRAFPPLEPAMGSLEPLDSYYDGAAAADDDRAEQEAALLKRTESRALKSYEKEECHGALIKLSSEDYERVYKSEGGGSGAMQGYEEIIVTCVPYDKSHPPVKAVAFRAREHVRLTRDPCPSKRYMTIIREGAAELGLKSCYQQWLEDHPVQDPSPAFRKLAINSMVFTITLSMGLKIRIVSHVQSWLLFKMYVLPTEPKWKQILGEVAAAIVLLPTALAGFVFKGLLEASGAMPPQLKRWVKMLEGE